jgi:hypothetical protein
MKLLPVRFTVRRMMVAVAVVAVGCAIILPFVLRFIPVPVRPVVRSFPAQGIQTVILRAWQAEPASVVTEPGTTVVMISGIPAGGSIGYHSSDPFYRDPHPNAVGLDFAAKIYGQTLVISSVNETHFIHHTYGFARLALVVPEGVKVVKEQRQLTRDGSPSLSPPEAL